MKTTYTPLAADRFEFLGSQVRYYKRNQMTGIPVEPDDLAALLAEVAEARAIRERVEALLPLWDASDYQSPVASNDWCAGIDNGKGIAAAELRAALTTGEPIVPPTAAKVAALLSHFQEVDGLAKRMEGASS